MAAFDQSLSERLSVINLEDCSEACHIRRAETATSVTTRCRRHWWVRGRSTRCRAFVQSPVVPENNVLVKFDMLNAFNNVRRDHFLEVCSPRAPSMHRIALTAYAMTSHLVIGNETILSETGVQDGDPLGLVMFALAVGEIANSVRSPINIWYLDDIKIGGPVKCVCEDLRRSGEICM